MKLCLPLSLLLLIFSAHHSSAIQRVAKRDHESYHYYALEHDPFTGVPLQEILSEFGLRLVEQVGQLQNHWLVARKKVSGRDHPDDPVILKHRALKNELRRKSDHTIARSEEAQKARRIAHAVRHLSVQERRQRTKRDDSFIRNAQSETGALQNTTSSSRAVAERLGIRDPLFNEQWHIFNSEFMGNMLNVIPVWDMGITGKGVKVSMIDDGLDYTSDDLAGNFDEDDSYDYNDHEDLPTPKLSDDHHGTRCAGQIAAVRNEICGVGIAYESKVAGVRILSGPITDVDEAAALNQGYQNVSIYSCSWGPPDDGMSLEGPEYIIGKAVLNGIQNGRDGKGSIFVFASGNGAAQGDQCNFDGYTNSIYSVTVSAIDYKFLHPFYSESCAANMVVAPSSGSGKNIVTTDVGKDKCSRSHGGTSAAAPNAVGVFTLALEVRPDLTWRDIQHLCVETAKVVNSDDPDWEKMASGRSYSYKYGFGVLDAYAYVTAAQDWQVVKPQGWIELPPLQIENGTMNSEGRMSNGALIGSEGLNSYMTVTKGMLQDNNFEKLEHVNVKVWISHGIRGDVEVQLVSPNGITSILASRRRHDQATTGFPGWTFMTLKHWGENPIGDWTLKVSDQRSEGHQGYLIGWSMTLWGSVIDPALAKPYVLLDIEPSFPPVTPSDEGSWPSETSSSPVSSATKAHSKPIDHLPGNHTSAEGEADRPAFPSVNDDSAAISSTSSNAFETGTPTYTPDEGWFSDLSKLIHDQKWIFGAIAVVLIFGLSSVAYLLWRRRRSVISRGQYTSVLGDVPMDAMDRAGGAGVAGGRTKELYDAFGEVSDDEDANEETRFTTDSVGRTLTYHSGFLDDDEAASGSYETQYKDQPADATYPAKEEPQ